jgi:NAD+ diphosphatase
MPHRLTYAGAPLDRAGDLRGNTEWINQQLRAASARFLVVWHDFNLIIGNDEPQAVFMEGAAAQNVLNQLSVQLPPVFLGQQDNLTFFMLDLSHMAEDQALLATGHSPDHAGFVDLRSVGGLVSHGTGSTLAMARALAYWHKRHFFCGACGAATKSHTAGHVRACTNDDCKLDHFPRTDPAVIMLVTTKIKGEDHCLLGRQASWIPGMYSALAGFVEPGESLETAVLREVFEEAGIRATSATYLASQPWPFPSSLMLGYRATAISHDIDTSSNELEDARWFSHSEITALAQHDSDDLILSRSESIARWLIEDWIKNP